MKRYLKPVFTMVAFALLVTSNVLAVSEEKIIIALKTDDFELARRSHDEKTGRSQL